MDEGGNDKGPLVHSAANHIQACDEQARCCSEPFNHAFCKLQTLAASAQHYMQSLHHHLIAPASSVQPRSSSNVGASQSLRPHHNHHHRPSKPMAPCRAAWRSWSNFSSKAGSPKPQRMHGYPSCVFCTPWISSPVNSPGQFPHSMQHILCPCLACLYKNGGGGG